MRCVAALCVLCLHTRAVFGGTPVFGRGYIGVDFFLMLSGFLMARVQEPRWVTAGAGWRFMRGRYRRLWPMMAIGTATGMAFHLVHSDRAAFLPRFWLVGGVNLALLPAPDASFAFPFDIPAWTIFGELVVNALHVSLLRHVRGRWLWLVLALLVPVMVWIAQGPLSLNVGPAWSTLMPGLLRCLFAYIIGIALGRAWHAQPPPVPPWLAVAAMPAALVGLWALHARGWWVDLMLVVVLCPAMLAGGLRLQSGERLCRLAGRLAFPLFAWQIPVLEGLRGLGGGYWLGFFAALAAGILGIFVEDRLHSPAAAHRNVAGGD